MVTEVFSGPLIRLVYLKINANCGKLYLLTMSMSMSTSMIMSMVVTGVFSGPFHRPQLSQ